jgi:hypothetical protein
MASLTFETQTLPLTPGSLVVRRCILLIGVAGVLGPIMSRSMLIVIAVLRSHFEAVGDSERLCHRAVFMIKGVLGSNSFSIAEGEDSIVIVLLRGVKLQRSDVAVHANGNRSKTVYKGSWDKSDCESEVKRMWRTSSLDVENLC